MPPTSFYDLRSSFLNCLMSFAPQVFTGGKLNPHSRAFVQAGSAETLLTLGLGRRRDDSRFNQSNPLPTRM